MKAIASALALILVLGASGCSSVPSPADALDKPSPGEFVGLASHNRYVDHRSKIVSGPAAFGMGLGTLVGIPIMVVALPVTIPLGIAAWSDDPHTSNLQVLGNAVAFPDAACAVGGAYAFGSLPYAIVGPSTPRTPDRAVIPAAAPPPSDASDPLDPMLPPLPPSVTTDEMSSSN